jgi:tyrosyl-tRNA synthetase
MDAYGEFEWRGLVYDSTDGLREALANAPMTAYSGFDATAASLHVGHLLPLLGLARLQRHGHRPIALVGGGTGLIGDPSGKSAERVLLTAEQVTAHAEGIRGQLSRFLDFETPSNRALLLNNAEWLTSMSAMEFLRDIGKHFSVNAMLAKESVRRRLESEDGISYTEFSYSLLQACDYRVLHDRFQCTLQIGGSDQWGNIVAGCDLIRRVSGARAHGLVMPLLTTAAGAKFGKTEAGAIWLDPRLTRPYAFYQFWLNTEDQDAGRYLRFFTFLDRSSIDTLVAAGAAEPERRLPQRALAREVTRLVHGDEAVRTAEAAAAKLFSGDVAGMSVTELLEVFADVPSSMVPLEEQGWSLVDLLASTAVTASKGEAARLIRAGGLYLNDRRVTDERMRVRVQDAVDGQVFVVRKGKKDSHLIRIMPSGASARSGD